MELLSIIVPAYNVGGYLDKCLSSILAQTYRELELIVVDDGSTDDSGRIADAYSGKDERVRVIHKENAGLPQARRTGVENASGTYIGFVDADDYVEPDMYAVLMELIGRTQADIACAGFFWDEHGKAPRAQRFRAPGETVFSPKEALAGIHRLENVMSAMWNKVYKASLFAGVEYPAGNPVGEDYCIQVQLVQKSAAIAQTDRPLYHYVQRRSSTCHVGYTPERKRALDLYGHWRGRLLGQFPDAAGDIVPYHLREELAVIVAMGRGGHAEPELARRIQADVRRNLALLLRSRVEPTMKMAGFFTAIHWRVLLLYGALQRLLPQKSLYDETAGS